MKMVSKIHTIIKFINSNKKSQHPSLFTTIKMLPNFSANKPFPALSLPCCIIIPNALSLSQFPSRSHRGGKNPEPCSTSFFALAGHATVLLRRERERMHFLLRSRSFSFFCSTLSQPGQHCMPCGRAVPPQNVSEPPPGLTLCKYCCPRSGAENTTTCYFEVEEGKI